jgi:hypothetical protein
MKAYIPFECARSKLRVTCDNLFFFNKLCFFSLLIISTLTIVCNYADMQMNNLMCVPCITKSIINNQHYALNCTTPLFNIQAPTCFGNSLPSSGNFFDSSELLEMRMK